jgi:hypothetical protein
MRPVALAGAMLTESTTSPASGDVQPLTDCFDTSAPTRGAVEVSPRRLLEDELVEGEVGDRSAQPVVLALEVLEVLGLGDLEAAVRFAPAVVGDLVDAEGVDDLRDLLALAQQDLGLAQLGDDLLWAVGLAWPDVLPS